MRKLRPHFFKSSMRKQLSENSKCPENKNHELLKPMSRNTVGWEENVQSWFTIFINLI